MLTWDDNSHSRPGFRSRTIGMTRGHTGEFPELQGDPTARIQTLPSVVENFWYAGFEQLGELLGKHRRTEIVPLRLVTLVSLKKCQLLRSEERRVGKECRSR